MSRTIEKMNQRYNLAAWCIILLSVIALACNEGNTTSGNESKPEIESLTPTSGPVGVSIVINGSNFSTVNTENKVSFNGTNADVTSSSVSSLETTVPSGATTGTVVVSVNGEEVTGPVFTVEENAPAISSVEPDSGKVGDEVSIQGMNLGSLATTSVLFGNVQSTLSSVTSTEIIVGVPEGVTEGTIDLNVNVENKTAIFTDFKILTEQEGIIPKHVSGGGRHTCAIDKIGDAYCWGINSRGQLGTGITGSNKESPQAVRMLFETKFQQIEAGRNHTVALDLNGNIWTWGVNDDGQLGDGTTQSSRFIKQVEFPESVTFVKVTAGQRHTAALDENGQVWAWGENSFGRLGDGTETDRLTPVKVNMPDGVIFSDVIAGAGRTMALTESGEYWGWGFNGNGRLGNGNSVTQLEPIKGMLPVEVEFVQLAASATHSLAIDNNGKLWAWGSNGEGQLGDGTTTDRLEPTAVSISSGLNFESIKVGISHNLAKATDGSIWAWGDNNYGELGINSSDNDQFIPVMIQVPSNETFESIWVGDNHSLAISTKDEIWAWGFNNTGQLGDSTQVNRSLPVKVKF